MGSPGQRLRLGGRNEDACQHQALRVSRPKTGMETKDLIELLQQIGRECNDAFILWQWQVECPPVVKKIWAIDGLD